jgi:hypothetical protein
MKTITLMICLILPATVFAEIYKWTDEQGQVHYGEKPAGNASDSTVVPQHYKQPSTPAPDAKQRLDNMRKWNDARQKERAAEKQKKAELKKQRAEKKQQCVTLENDLADMERGGIAWYNLNEAGERVYISDQEIESRKNEMRETIKKNCR